MNPFALIRYAGTLLIGGARASILRVVVLGWLALTCSSPGAETRVEFSAPGKMVSCYDFAEGVLRVPQAGGGNPFTDVVVEGSFGLQGEKPLAVEGFCDAPDGSIFRMMIRWIRIGKRAISDALREPGVMAFCGSHLQQAWRNAV